MYNFYPQKLVRPPRCIAKILLIMRLTTLLLISAILQVSASTYAQKISLSEKNATLSVVFDKISDQSGYDFVFTTSILKSSKPVSINVQNKEFEEVLKEIFNDQPLSFSIKKKTVVISLKEPSFLDRVVDAFTPPIDVRGIVVDEKGMPLPGANVKVKGFKQAAVTDNEGRFYLPGVDDRAVLVVSFVGYKDVEVGVKASLSVALELKAAELNEVVVAYGRTTQQALTGSVTVVKGEQIQNLPNRSFDKSLQGLVPGLLVTSGTGQPGSAPSNFVLRGIATGGQPTDGQTFRNPLIVIDGVPVSQDPATITAGLSFARITNPLAQLNPSDIESISVLKDAAAIALYGSKASNGVILVTTKRGKIGKTVFNFRHQTDISAPLQGKIEMLNQQEYSELLYEAYKNSDPTKTDASILADLKTKFPTKSDGSFFPQSDWNSTLYHNSALTMGNEISVSGGTDRSNFYLNLEYTKENGVTRKSGYDRKSIRFNYENSPAIWLKLGTNIALSYNIQDYANAAGFESTSYISPLNSVGDQNGNYFYNFEWGNGQSQGVLTANPAAATELNINTSTAYRGLSKLFGQLTIFKDFTFTSTLGVDFMLNEAKEKIHPLLAIRGSTGIGSIQDQNFRTANIISTNILRFDREFLKQHAVNILIGQESQILTNKYSIIKLQDISSNPTQDQLTNGTISVAQGNVAKQTLMSYFGQVNYAFHNKYFLSASIRSDGSSLFGDNNRFGTYWSVGTGWVISSESFMKSTSSWLNYLKIRGSMGPSGNSASVANNLRYDRLQPFPTNYSGNTAVLPFTDLNPGNPSIQWERTFTWDAGIELRIAKQRLTVTADVYNRKTQNMISNNISIPLATGFTRITGNIGDITNHGIELSATANIIQKKDFRWSINANWSKNRNKLTKSFFPRSTVSGTSGYLVNEVGYEFNSFFLPTWSGVNSANGRPMWVDSTGKASEDYYAAKPAIVGKAQPDGFGSVTQSLSYRGFELAISLYYQYGSKIFFTSDLQNDGMYPYLNQAKSALNRWQKPGDAAVNPRRLYENITVTGDYDEGTNPSTRYLYDGDFIRLSNIVLAYHLPGKLINRLHLNSAKIFVQGHNLVTWTKYSGQDPENVGPSGFGSILYPQQQSFTIGLNVNF
jgi:TonB-linked SusC/RagA family outer membrane protein